MRTSNSMSRFLFLFSMLPPFTPNLCPSHLFPPPSNCIL